MRKVKVALGENSYNIFIGSNINDELTNFVKSANFSHKAMLITDTNVEKIYSDMTAAAIAEAGLDVEIAAISAGEPSKSLQVAESIYTKVIEFGLDRKSAIFALGGGVVGDLAGFIAATYMRGVPFVQIPTSLLAQVDSSVGGKVAVNHKLGKNLIGAFYQPKAVFIDLECLRTLMTREIGSGLGEIVKYGIISDSDFFAYLETNFYHILALDNEYMEHVIARSCEIKADVVSKDEKESGLRRILNFGHTMAHAIEEATDYTGYTHGEAVAVGMIGAMYMSVKLGRIGNESLERLESLINKFAMVSHIKECNIEHMMKTIYRDKKTINGKISWVLPDAIGKVSIVSDVPTDIVKDAFNYIVK